MRPAASMTVAPPLRSIPPSIPVTVGTLARAVDLLGRVEALPGATSGALRFETGGLVLVESQGVCWAAASGMRPRFTQVLRHQHDPPLARKFLVEVYRRCKDDQGSLVDALLATGVVASAGLRAALFAHTVEAVAHIALAGARYQDFVPQARYGARFHFSGAEILAALGARSAPVLATAADQHLATVLVPETTGWAFLRNGGLGAPLVVAMRGQPAVSVTEMLEISAWAAGLFDVTGIFDGEIRIASASWAHGRNVVAWRTAASYFAACSANRAGAARLVAALERVLLDAPDGSA